MGIRSSFIVSLRLYFFLSCFLDFSIEVPLGLEVLAGGVVMVYAGVNKDGIILIEREGESWLMEEGSTRTINF